jgi:hypothetical protein
LSEGAVRYTGAKGTLSTAEREILSNRREELIAYLRACGAGVPPAFLPQHGDNIHASITQQLWWNWIHKNRSLVVPVEVFFSGGNSDIAARAIKAVWANQDGLRFRFREEQGRLIAALNPQTGLNVEIEAIGRYPASHSAVRKRVAEFVDRPLLRDSALLTRAKVIETFDGTIAVMVMNHLVADGRSRGIISSLLRDYVQKLSAGEAIELQGLPQYTDFSLWQRQWLEKSGPDLVQYWKAWVESVPPLVSPIGKKPLIWGAGTKTRHQFTLHLDVVKKIEARSKELATTPFTLYLTMYAIAISRWAKQENFAIRSIYDLRVLPQLQGIVGLMTGADAIKIYLRPEMNLRQSVNLIEAEYYGTTKVRLPTLYAFSPHVADGADGRDDQKHNPAAVINYWSSRQATPAKYLTRSWPPKVSVSSSARRPQRVSPIYHELKEEENGTTVIFDLLDEALTRKEQKQLVKHFLNVVLQVLERSI